MAGEPGKSPMLKNVMFMPLGGSSDPFYGMRRGGDLFYFLPVMLLPDISVRKNKSGTTFVNEGNIFFKDEYVLEMLWKYGIERYPVAGDNGNRTFDLLLDGDARTMALFLHSEIAFCFFGRGVAPYHQ